MDNREGGLYSSNLILFPNNYRPNCYFTRDKPANWKWGEFNKVTFAHPLSAVKSLNLLFNPSTKPMGGSALTVAAAGNAKTGEVDHAAPWRTVIDLANMNKNYSVVGPGQSGQVLSPWYAD